MVPLAWWSPSSSVAEVARTAAASLVSVKDWGSSSFISLPLIYPGGGFVTVKLERVKSGTIRVSDNGFAFRELESIGAQRSFGKMAPGIIEPLSVEVDRRRVFVDVAFDQVERAICDVAIASWQIADRVVGRAAEQDEIEIQEYLKDRLVSIFGTEKVEPDYKLVGPSTTEWDVSAVVKLSDHMAVFHAVANQPYSVFRTSAAFHDLANLPKPPTLTSVVRSKQAMGAKFALLAQAGRVIEEEQDDKVYLSAA
jgi:hypothetical protein